MDEALIRALVNVGYTKEEAIGRIAAAHRADNGAVAGNKRAAALRAASVR